MERNQVKGAVKRTTGRAKAVAGRVVGDPKLEIDGRLDEGEGIARSAVGAARNLVSDTGVENLVRETGKALHGAGERVYDEAQAKLGGVGTALRAQGTRYAGVVDQGVRTRPYAALFVAGAIGYALAVLSRRG